MESQALWRHGPRFLSVYLISTISDRQVTYDELINVADYWDDFTEMEEVFSPVAPVAPPGANEAYYDPQNAEAMDEEAAAAVQSLMSSLDPASTSAFMYGQGIQGSPGGPYPGYYPYPY
jgi:hypothetical protein